MERTGILCASDLTNAATTALRFAFQIGSRLNERIGILHVIDKDGSEEEATILLKQQLVEAGGGEAQILIAEGDALAQIAEESRREHRLLVLGTHGLSNLRQKWFGADILKLVRKVSVPSFVVQEGTVVSDRLGPIVMPVAAHEDIDRLIGTVIVLAKAFLTEVHVYQIMRPGEQPSDELLANKVKMLDRLREAGANVKEVNEPGNSPSISFAGPTLEYAERIGAGCVAIMAHASKEYRYMADAEKERMLTNEARIPILCA